MSLTRRTPLSLLGRRRRDLPQSLFILGIHTRAGVGQMEGHGAAASGAL